MKTQHEITIDNVENMDAVFLDVYKKQKKWLINYLNGFDTVKGVIDPSVSNSDTALLFHKEYETALIDNGFKDALDLNYSNDKILIDAIKEASLHAEIPIEFTRKSSQILTSLRKVNFEGLKMIGAGSADTLARGLLGNVMTGQSLNATRAKLTKTLDTNLHGYIETYINTSKHDLFQEVHNLSAENYDGKLFWRFVGVRDDITRPACIVGLNKDVFTDKEKIAFEDKYATQRAWNCRHVFMRMSEYTYNDIMGLPEPD